MKVVLTAIMNSGDKGNGTGRSHGRSQQIGAFQVMCGQSFGFGLINFFFKGKIIKEIAITNLHVMTIWIGHEQLMDDIFPDGTKFLVKFTFACFNLDYMASKSCTSKLKRLT